MKGTVRKLFSSVLVFIMVLSCLALNVHAEQTAASGEQADIYDEGKMNLDVVFVLDASGSMKSSDPNKIAIDAFNLFLDLSDETCGMGYSIYTEKIIASNPIVSLSDPKNIDSLKKSISDIYKPYGYTDIALGLTDALNIHLANKDADSSRKKAVILLSDGNTQLIEGSSRTLEDAQKEMESTKVLKPK